MENHEYEGAIAVPDGDPKVESVADLAIGNDSPVSADDSDPDTSGWPDYIRDLDSQYKSNRSHVFILHGNVRDYPDNSGVSGNLTMALFDRFDDEWIVSRVEEDCKRRKVPVPDYISKLKTGNRKLKRVAAVYTIDEGLVFATSNSLAQFKDFVLKHSPNIPEDMFKPGDLTGCLQILQEYFRVSSRVFASNYAKKLEKKLASIEPEISLTVIFQNAELCFPAGDLGNMVQDRTPVGIMQNWALNGSLASRNKIILIVPRLSDLHESLRTSDSRVGTIRVRRPNLEERKEWVENYIQHIRIHPPIIRNKPRTEIVLDEDVTLDVLANGTAGMSRVQIEGLFMESWLEDTPVDMSMISRHKQRANEAEYGEIVNIKQPVGHFDLVGGHQLLKEYLTDFVLDPLLLGDKRRVTRGLLLSGPPGTGKTFLAECLAAMAKFNFIEADFSRLFGGIVGETERKTEQFFEAIEAMSPCIVFCDEIDSVFSSGRQSPGDSGVQARMFNKVMRWLSSPARWGQVVVIAATNRPDLLDAAFIRAGRFDDILPCLPPAGGDAKGRAQILEAIRKKHGYRISKDLAETTKTAASGLGRLLYDTRIWTGAEIERLMNLAFSYAARRAVRAAKEKVKAEGVSRRDMVAKIREMTRNPVISFEDWEHAMQNYLPNTRDVEHQIELALRFCNNLEYCPEAYRSRLIELRQAKSEDGYMAVSPGLER